MIIRSILLAVVIAVFATCSDSTGPNPTPEPQPPGPAPPLPIIETTAGFGDSPVVGELILDPIPGEDVWRYEVDLDADGTIEFASLLTESVALFYRFETPGIHPIQIHFTFERIDEEVQRETERFVVVNDPSAFVIEQRFSFPPDSARPEGIAVTRDNEHLFVSGGFFKVVFRLRTDNLAVVKKTSLRGLAENTLEGFALSPSESRLFVFNKRSSITVLSVPETEIVGHVSSGSLSQFFIEALDEDRVVVSGRGDTVTRVNVQTGLVEAQRGIEQAWDIELSPSREAIVVVTRDFEDRSQIQLLDAMTLEVEWVTELTRPAALTSVAFHPSGDRIYALGLDDDAYWLFVVQTEDGHLLREFRIEPRGHNSVEGVANPTATTHDERFVIFSTDLGAYFVNTSLDVPQFRLTDRVVGPSPPRLQAFGCCNVATPQNSNAIYFVNFGEVFKVRVVK